MVGYAQNVISSRLGNYIANQYDELHDIPIIARNAEINIKKNIEKKHDMQKIENIKKRGELWL